MLLLHGSFFVLTVRGLVAIGASRGQRIAVSRRGRGRPYILLVLVLLAVIVFYVLHRRVEILVLLRLATVSRLKVLRVCLLAWVRLIGIRCRVVIAVSITVFLL